MSASGFRIFPAAYTTGMPILLICLVTAACLDRVPWANPLSLSPRSSVLLTAGLVVLI